MGTPKPNIKKTLPGQGAMSAGWNITAVICGLAVIAGFAIMVSGRSVWPLVGALASLGICLIVYGGFLQIITLLRQICDHQLNVAGPAKPTPAAPTKKRTQTAAAQKAPEQSPWLK